MTQVELDDFTHRMEAARLAGNTEVYTQVKDAFKRRLVECQVHTGQRITAMDARLTSLEQQVSMKLAAISTKMDAGFTDTKDQIEELRDHERSLKDKISGAKILWHILEIAAASGGGALILQLLQSGAAH